jgi:hypothetical protein
VVISRVKAVTVQSRTVRTDVTVVGGGLAGVAAAVAAARTGASVALINNRPVLGGNSSSEVRVWVCGATAHGAQKFARETGVMGELFVENQYRNPEGNPHYWDQVVLDIVRAEPNIQLFLNTDVREVEAEGSDGDRVIRAVTGWQMGSEKLYRFVSDVFVEATGDGLVGELAGAWYSSGREARSVFGEEWAPEVPDDNMLGSTIFFYTKDAGEPVRFVAPSIAKDIRSTSILEHRRIDTAANGCDYWWIEWGGELDAVDDNELIRDELWAVVYGIWDHIKNSGEFDADNLTLEWVGSLPGKREYRRFHGDHVLTQHDIMNQTRFDDAVGFGGWSIDLHPPGGMYSRDEGSKHLFTSGVYHIPFRSLYSQNVNNLLLAGRNISASHVAFGTTRVMATCAVTGEAAGVGAALAARHGITPRELVNSHVSELHGTLLRHDASVLGVEWNDVRDLALTASASASSTLDDLRVVPTDAAVPFSLDEHEVGIVLPADPGVDRVHLLLDATAATSTAVQLWSTAGGENHIPVRLLAETTVAVARAGRSWVTAEFGYRPATPEEVVVVIGRSPQLSLVVDPGAAPYGVLGLVSRTPRLDTHRPQSNAWSAFEIRRRAPVFAVEPRTAAYSAQQVVGGLQRPFNGPQLWSSVAAGPHSEQWVELRWQKPVDVATIELIFNDDVDEDLVNLHHHRTPFAVIPELVRDYRLTVETPDGWMNVVDVTGNRVRRRVHSLDRPVQTRGLRLSITATNGAAAAMVAALRVFAE